VSGFNRIKPARARKAAARELMQQIDELLRQGYTEGGQEALSDSLAFLQESEADFNLSTFTLRQAVVYFINYKNSATLKNKADGLEENYREGLARIKKNTFDAYKTFLKVLSAWMEEHKLNKLLLAQCNVKVVHQFFTHLKEEKGLGNKTFNNYRGYFSAVFNYYIEQQELPIKNPISRVLALEVDDSELHQPYTSEQLSLIKQTILEQGDRQLWLFINFFYYTFARPTQEIRLLQVKDIRENTIYIPAARAKNNKGEHIPIHEELEALIQACGLRNYPKEHFVFTAKQVPGTRPVTATYFYKRHRKFLDKLGMLDKGYTLYGYKHTGAINFYTATKDLLAVQKHCRHSTASQTETYLRKYGVIATGKVLQIPKFGT
jgi:integrase